MRTLSDGRAYRCVMEPEESMREGAAVLEAVS